MVRITSKVERESISLNFRWVRVVLIILTVLTAVLGVLSSNGEFFITEGTSMLPIITPFSIIYVVPCDTYEEGDIICFDTEKKCICHRVTERVKYGYAYGKYITKGDNETVARKPHGLPWG